MFVTFFTYPDGDIDPLVLRVHCGHRIILNFVLLCFAHGIRFETVMCFLDFVFSIGSGSNNI